jgi:hypothetical protein
VFYFTERNMEILDLLGIAIGATLGAWFYYAITGRNLDFAVGVTFGVWVVTLFRVYGVS